jgi:hypothetical protein
VITNVGCLLCDLLCHPFLLSGHMHASLHVYVFKGRHQQVILYAGCLLFRVGQNHAYKHIHGRHEVFLAGEGAIHTVVHDVYIHMTLASPTHV